jgi:hypothetical protein
MITIVDFLTDFTIDDLKSTQICPDLSYFKKTKNLDTSIEHGFVKKFLAEFNDSLDNEKFIDELNSHASFMDEVNLGDIDNELNSQSVVEGGDSPYSDPASNLNFEMKNVNNFGNSMLEGLSYLKTDDIKQYIHQFGDGNKDSFKNLPEYNNFTKAFNQLQSLKSVSFEMGAKKEKRVKKEEKLFTFSEDTEIDRDEIFDKTVKETKTKKDKIDLKKEMKKRKKVKTYYRYDKS